MYRIFESNVRSDIPLVGLQTALDEGFDLAVRRGERETLAAIVDWQHTWHEPGGEPVLHYSAAPDAAEISPILHSNENGAPATDTQHFLRFPDLAEFCVQGSTVTCFPLPACDDETLSHLLVDQVLPRMWAQLGRCVLHGSAVVYPDGGVALFLGESGFGKSTLATALGDHGCILLSDDCVSLVPEKKAIRVVPSYRSLRLHPDVVEEMAKEDSVVGRMGRHSNKLRMDVSQLPLPSTVFLQRIYCLDVASDPDRVLGKPLTGSELLAELIKASFMLDIRDADLGAANMQQLGVVANSVSQAERLHFPRKLELLPSVVEFLLD